MTMLIYQITEAAVNKYPDLTNDDIGKWMLSVFKESGDDHYVCESHEQAKDVAAQLMQ